jgi:hypothetical protein
VGSDLAGKVSAFCRELSDGTLQSIAQGRGEEQDYLSAVELLRSGAIGPELEARLDALERMAVRVQGYGFYPVTVRSFYSPLPGLSGDTGALWWTCPRRWCDGRGMVFGGQEAPVCQAAGEPLRAEPLAE